MDLPPEILGMVFGLLSKETLKSTRFVCKTFDQAAVPFLFDQLFISDERCDLVIADLVIKRFSRHIRMLDFQLLRYSILSYDDFVHQFKNSLWGGPGPSCFEKRMKHTYHTYQSRLAEKQEVAQNGECLAQLCSALTEIPCLSKVMTTEGRSTRVLSQESSELYGSWDLKYTCQLVSCECRDPGSIGDIKRMRWCGLSDWYAEPWLIVLLALSVTESTVRDLRYDNRYRDRLTPISLFDISQSQAQGLSRTFRNLTTLRLNFCQDDDRYWRFDSCGKARGNIANILASACNLESLSISHDEPHIFLDCEAQDAAKLFDSKHGTRFYAIFGGCNFPKLKSLATRSLHSTEYELASFLKRSPKLTHLQLGAHILVSGSWESLAETIKSLQLKTVQIEEVYGGLRPPFRYVYHQYGYYQNPYRSPVKPNVIEDFCVRDGQNPFRKELLDVLHAESYGICH